MTDQSPTPTPSKPVRPLRRRLIKLLKAGSAGFAIIAAILLALAWKPMGSAPTGQRLTTMQASPQWQDSHFENPQPLYNDTVGMFTGMLDASKHGSPDEPLPVIKVEPARFKSAPASGLRITWLGHSITIIEIDGYTVLTDPVWGPRASPFTFVGPARWYEPLIELEDLPKLDAILISHDHYDHLDYPTITALKDKGIKFIVPLGVGAHLEGWGIPKTDITELDWWQEHSIGELKITSAPARHASGRQVFDQNRTLWAGYAIKGPQHNVYFSGDTGLTPQFKEVGQKLGPFDVTMVEVGAYNRAWPDWHIGPEQAITAHQWLRGKTFIPIHWGLFNLALHGWTEPIERTTLEAQRRQVPILTPKPGQSLEPTLPQQTTAPWWPKVPWQTAQQHPIVSTNLGAD